jgi:hypothetical protein
MISPINVRLKGSNVNTTSDRTIHPSSSLVLIAGMIATSQPSLPMSSSVICFAILLFPPFDKTMAHFTPARTNYTISISTDALLGQMHQQNESGTTVVFPKEGQLAECYAIRHGVWLRQNGRRYELRCQKLFWSFAAQSPRYALRSQKLIWNFAAQGWRYVVCQKVAATNADALALRTWSDCHN